MAHPTGESIEGSLRLDSGGGLALATAIAARDRGIPI
jgi:hypothetical protein